MLLKRLLSFGAAALIACSCVPCAFADDSEEEPIKFKVDKDMTVSEKDKIGYTFSFDNKDWKSYMDLTDDSKKAGLSIDTATSKAYQGASLKVSANSKDIKDKQNFCWALNDEAGVDADTEGLITMGIEIDAKDLGVTTFDGSMIVFTYRFDESGVNSLLGNSIVAFTAKEDGYRDSGGYIVVQKNDTISNNITQFRDAVLSVPTKGNSTKLIIEIPVSKSYSGEIITIDNLDICLPGDNGYIKNLDGYNENATPKETVEELEIKEKKKTENVQIATEKEHSSKSKGPVVVVIVIVGILLLAGGAVLFVKLKDKFY
mgnify:CR=1 FL=1